MFLAVWSRAVIVPAWRRAAAVWVGAGIAGGIIFGPTGMHPHELTHLALGIPAVGAILALTWLLVFVPTARLVVRADAASYLRSLPGPRWSPLVARALALVALQLPWVALWIAGDGLRGLAIVVALTLVIALIAGWRPRVRPAAIPHWTRDRQALRGIYVRALRRRASDALLRGAGLSILAGLVAALLVRNNALVGRDAAVLGAAVISLMLIPACTGALLPLLDAHRQSGWLASSLGISSAARVLVVATVVAGVYLVGAVVALAAAAVAISWILDSASSLAPDSGVAVIADASIQTAPLATIVWIGAVTLATSIASSMIATRALIRAGGERHVRDRSTAADGREDRDERGAAVRVVVGAIVASAVAVLCIGWLGIAGVGASVAVGICALVTARPA